MIDSFTTAVKLLANLDQEVIIAVWTSLYTTIVSVALASLIAIPFGLAVGVFRFRGRRGVIIGLNTLMALPTVVIGLLVFSLLNRYSVFGGLGLMFTPIALIIGQTFLAVPIITHYALGAAEGADQRIVPTVRGLGGSRLQVLAVMLKEVRFGIGAAVVAGFGRVIAEVGVAMMLGGNIRGFTRTMTTAIALETSKGEFAFGIALGIVLMIVALLVNIGLNLLQQLQWRAVSTS